LLLMPPWFYGGLIVAYIVASRCGWIALLGTTPKP
jgi:hypothetical protein